MVGREDKRTNNRTMLPILKNNAAAGYKVPVKLAILKSIGLLSHSGGSSDTHYSSFTKTETGVKC